MPLSTAVAGDTVAAIAPGGHSASPGLASSKYQFVAPACPKDLYDCILINGITAKDTGAGAFNIASIDSSKIFSVDTCWSLWFGSSGSTNGSTIGFVVVLWASEPDGTLRLMGVGQGRGLTSSNYYISGGRYPATDTDVRIDLQGAATAAIVITDISAGNWNLVIKPM